MKEDGLISENQLFREENEENERVFQLIFKQYHLRMLSFTRKMVKSPHAAEEIVQEVFIRLWEHRELLPYLKKPENYIFIAIRNYALNYLRTAAKEQSRREQLWEALEQRAAGITTTVEMQETEQLFEKMLNKLSRQQQKIFRMSREEGFSHQEIADELQLSKNTVKKHIAESLKIIRMNLTHSGWSLLIFVFH